MATPGILLSEGAARDITKCVMDFKRRGPWREPPPSPRSASGQRYPIRGILLAPLADGGQCDCAVTSYTRDNNLQLVSLLGNPGLPAPASLSLGFGGATTTPIPWSATPAQMQSGLASIGAIGAKGCTVALGKQTYVNPGAGTSLSEFPGLWIVTFLGKYDPSNPRYSAQNPAPTPPLLTLGPTAGLSSAGVLIQKYQWADTGVVEIVTAMTPIGSPTPMPAGSVVTCIFYPGLGYGVQTCESRQYSPTVIP